MRSETSAPGVQIQKLKKELGCRYQLISKTPEIQIDYDYFSLISKYIDRIKMN